MNVGITPTQFQAIERRKAFHAKINAMAVAQSQPQERSIGIKGYQATQQVRTREFVQRISVPVKALPPAAYPAEPDPPPIVYPVIPMERVWTGMIIIPKIQEIVAKHYNVSQHDILSAKRNWNFVLPRHVAIFLSRDLTDRSFPDIGRRFGGRDHATVINALRKIAARIAADPWFAAEVDFLRTQVLNAIAVPADTECEEHV